MKNVIKTYKHWVLIDFKLNNVNEIFAPSLVLNVCGQFQNNKFS